MFIKSALVLSAVAVAACAAAESVAFDKLQYQFQVFKERFNKVYATEEENTRRFAIFRDSLNYVESFNNAAHSHYIGINSFADLTEDERAAKLLPIRGPFTGTEMAAAAAEAVEALPSTWDWRKQNYVTPVQNQGQCGSAGAYAGVDAISSCHAITTKQLVELSVDNVVQCSGSGGCNGGQDASTVFAYVKANGGIDGQSCYSANSSQSCHYSETCCASELESYTIITSGNEQTLQAAVYKTPVAVAIDASHMSFQMYSGGIYYESACSATQLDHSMLVVGYGTENNQDYWIAKNSWGTSWGMNGYILLSRNRNNNCGVASFAAVPEGCPNCSTHVAQAA